MVEGYASKSDTAAAFGVQRIVKRQRTARGDIP